MTDSLPAQPVTPIPANETERLAALYRYQVLDTPAEAAFDRLTALAARLFKIPTVLISLVDESRAWFKSSIGFGASEVRRNDTMCSFAVLSDEPLIVPDTRLDARFVCNPFVQCEPGMRFYAGAPLIDRDGFNLGTLCLLDTVPHDPLTAEQEATLVDLAAMVVSELELRLAAQQIARVDAALVEITQGVSRATGGEFFDELVRHFAKVLGADYVYIGLVEGTDPTKMMRTIATCDRGNIVDNLEYRLQDTPCWEAIEQRKLCCHPRNVQAQFPNAPLLKPLAVESYISIPFYGANGNVLGLLGVMDGKPLANVHLAESLLTIFASRIATELERQQYELMLVEQTRLLEAVSTGQPLDECLSAMCSSISKLSPNTRACVLLTDDRRTKFTKSIMPDFPSSLSQGLKDAPINELAIGTCSAAVYCGEPVTCNDIASDDRWSQKWRDLSIAHGIRACHSLPIMGVDNLPLGSVTLCFSEARLPTDWEYKLGEFGTKIASITIERKRSIEKLSESEERLNLALTAADMATWDADLSTGQAIWSAKHFEMLGYAPATDGAATVEMAMSLVHPDDLAAVMQVWETAQRERSIFCCERRFVRADTGAVVWVAATGRFLDNQAGSAMRFVGVMFDITERKQTEIALVESQQFVENVANTMPGMLYVYDLVEQRNIYSNRHSLELLGYTPEQLEELGTDITPTIVHPDDLPSTMAYQAKFSTALPGEVLEIEYRVRQANGEWCWLLSRSTVFHRTPAGNVQQILGVSIDISLRKQAEAALQESQKFVQKLTETLPGMVYVYDTIEQRNIYVNPQSVELLGYNPAQLQELGADFMSSLSHPDEILSSMVHLEGFQTAQIGEVREWECRWRHANGEWRWFLNRNTIFSKTPAGGVQQIIGVSIDITERKQAEANLEQSNARFESAMLAIRGAVYEWDLQTQIVYRSKGLFELVGIRVEDAVPTSEWWMERVHPDDIERAQSEFLAAPAKSDRFEGEYRVRHAAGHWIYVSDRSYFQYDSHGQMINIVGFASDITERQAALCERKRAEEELHQSQLLVQRQLMEIEAIYQTAPIGLAIFDRQLRYVRLNQRLAEINGIDIDDHMGRTLREIVPSVADENEPLLYNVIATGEPLLNLEISGETRAAPGIQRTWIENCYPLRDETGQVTGINIVVQEITDRKRAEAVLAERNQELNSFAYTVSHDLKAPLRAISNLSVWIEEDLEGKLPPDTQAQFDLLRTRVKRMESMIDSLLLYARAGRKEAQLETFHLAELLAEIIDSLAPPEGFRIDIQPPLPTLTTKRVFLSQVFANLISNAIKHHNSVTGHLHIWAIEHPDYHEFILKDDGPGIAPESHAKVFDIFTTLKVKDNSDSTGIGLAIVKKIVETEQGTIRLQSSLGEGTTFYVTWPKSHR